MGKLMLNGKGFPFVHERINKMNKLRVGRQIRDNELQISSEFIGDRFHVSYVNRSFARRVDAEIAVRKIKASDNSDMLTALAESRFIDGWLTELLEV